MTTHPETFLRIDQLGGTIPPYRPTFHFAGAFIDASHRRISRYPLKDDTLIQVRSRRWFGEIIPGWLRREDALKLYEMSYFAAGDVLELGAYHGLSASIIALASRKSGRQRHVYTVELDPACAGAAARTLGRMGLDRGVTVVCDDALAVVKGFASRRRQFGFIFVDHSHAYQPVLEVCRELPGITVAGGFCLFHDFNDPRNRDPACDDYGVYQAVVEGLDGDCFQFCGTYGCTGLYRAIDHRDVGA